MIFNCSHHSPLAQVAVRLLSRQAMLPSVAKDTNHSVVSTATTNSKGSLEDPLGHLQVHHKWLDSLLVIKFLARVRYFTSCQYIDAVRMLWIQSKIWKKYNWNPRRKWLVVLITGVLCCSWWLCSVCNLIELDCYITVVLLLSLHCYLFLLTEHFVLYVESN